MEELLHNWLPGGISSVYVISMSAKERSSVERHVRPHFKDMVHVDGYRPVVNSLADYRRLPYRVADRTQMHIHGGEGQAHHRDIASLGGIGCAISHLQLWKQVAAPSGWTTASTAGASTCTPSETTTPLDTTSTTAVATESTMALSS